MQPQMANLAGQWARVDVGHLAVHERSLLQRHVEQSIRTANVPSLDRCACKPFKADIFLIINMLMPAPMIVLHI